MKQLMIPVLALLFCGAAQADEYVLVKSPATLDDWKDKSFYAPADVPPTDGSATVRIPTGTSALVDDAAAEFVSGFKRLLPEEGAILTFDISSTADLGCAISSGDAKAVAYGELVKTGEGTLRLLSATNVPQEGDASKKTSFDYYTNIKVESGTLVCPPGNADVSTFYYGDIDVGTNGLLIPSNNKGESNTKIGSYINALTGGGVISNGLGTATRCILYPGRYSETPAVFSGRILDKIYYYAHGHQHLTGTNSTFSGGFYLNSNSGELTRGITGLAKIGNKGELSSAGLNDTLMLGAWGGRILYLGRGEKTNRDIQINESSSTKLRAGIVDAGATGGLTLMGAIDPALTSGDIQRCVLTGSNTVACVIKGAVKKETYDGKDSYVYLTKSGTGTWRLADGTASRAGIAGIKVKEGVLQFDSIAETNCACAIGEGVLMTEDKCTASATCKRVPYQFVLGGGGTRGTLEYSGSEDLWCTTRPAVLSGEGVLSNAGKDADGNDVRTVYMSGMSSIAEGTNTLVLAGAATSENVVAGVTDGVGSVGVVKEGPGTWVLAGTNTFTGGIAVREGKLILRSRSGKFTWFRFTIRQVHANDAESKSASVQMSQFGIWNADGNRINGGLQMSPFTTATTNMIGAGELPRISTNQVAMGRVYPAYVANSPDRSVDVLFSNTRGPSQAGFHASGMYGNIVESEPTTWMPIVMRLPSDCSEAAMYDLAIVSGNSSRFPTSWTMEGSVDGVVWYPIDAVAAGEVAVPANEYYWTFRSTKRFNNGGADTHVNGRPLQGSTNIVTAAYSCPVSVAKDAELEAEGLVVLSSLSVSPVQNGTLRGFRYADEGTIDLTTRPGRDVDELPLTILDSPSVKNLSAWSVSVNGRPSMSYSVSVTDDGKVKLNRSGLVLIVK